MLYKAIIRLHTPRGPCTHIVYTLAPKYPYRDYFKARVYTVWVPSSSLFGPSETRFSSTEKPCGGDLWNFMGTLSPRGFCGLELGDVGFRAYLDPKEPIFLGFLIMISLYTSSKR